MLPHPHTLYQDNVANLHPSEKGAVWRKTEVVSVGKSQNGDQALSYYSNLFLNLECGLLRKIEIFWILQTNTITKN